MIPKWNNEGRFHLGDGSSNDWPNNRGPRAAQFFFLPNGPSAPVGRCRQMSADAADAPDARHPFAAIRDSRATVPERSFHFGRCRRLFVFVFSSSSFLFITSTRVDSLLLGGASRLIASKTFILAGSSLISLVTNDFHRKTPLGLVSFDINDEFCWLQPSFTEFYRVLPGLTEFYRVLPGFTEFYRVYHGSRFAEPWWTMVFIGFHRVWWLSFFRVFFVCLASYLKKFPFEFKGF